MIFWLEPEEFPAWRARVELERCAGNLSLHRQKALTTLLAFVGDDGLFPSDAKVAELAHVSISTVRRARRDARELGLLTWEQTRKIERGRWVQGPNRYRVHVPTTPVCSGCQRDRRGRKQEKKAGLGRVEEWTPGASAEAARALLDALARSRTNAIAYAEAKRRDRHGFATWGEARLY